MRPLAYFLLTTRMKASLFAGMSMNMKKLLALASLILLSSQAHAGVHGIDDMFASFASSAASLIYLVVGGGFLLGLIVSFKAALSLKEYSESGGRTSFKTPMTLAVVGALLVALPGTINMATETMALGANTGLAVFDVGGSDTMPGLGAAMQGVLLFVKLIGHIAIVRGLLIFKKAGEGGQGGEVGRGLTHILGGAAAVNINKTIEILAATVGFPL